MSLTPDDLWLILRTLAGIGAVLLFLRWYEPRMLYYPNVPTADAFFASEAMCRDALQAFAVELVAADPPTVRRESTDI